MPSVLSGGIWIGQTMSSKVATKKTKCKGYKIRPRTENSVKPTFNEYMKMKPKVGRGAGDTSIEVFANIAVVSCRDTNPNSSPYYQLEPLNDTTMLMNSCY